MTALTTTKLTRLSSPLSNATASKTTASKTAASKAAAPPLALGVDLKSQESISDLVPPPYSQSYKRPYRLSTFSAQYLVDELEGPILQELRNLSLLFAQALREPPPEWAKSDAQAKKLQSATRGALRQWEAKLENTIANLSDLSDSAQSEASHSLRLTSHKSEKSLLYPPLEQPLVLPALSELSPLRYRNFWRYALGLCELIDQMIARAEHLQKKFSTDAPLNHGQLDRLAGGYANFRQSLRELIDSPQVSAPEALDKNAQNSLSRASVSRGKAARVTQKTELKSRLKSPSDSQGPAPRKNSRAATRSTEPKARPATKSLEPRTPSLPKSRPVSLSSFAAARAPEAPKERPTPSLSSPLPHNPAAQGKGATSLLGWSTPSTPQPLLAVESTPSRKLPPLTPASLASLTKACNQLRALRQRSLSPPDSSAPTEEFPEHLRRQVEDMVARLVAAKNLPQEMRGSCSVIAASLEMLLAVFSTGQAPVGVNQELSSILGLVESA